MERKPIKHCRLLSGYLLLAAVVSLSVYPQLPRASTSPQFETRCGWFSNPTPANIWLYDREGQWTFGVQGGYQVEGDSHWPTFKAGQWVRTNGDHGYGCVCMQVRVNKQRQEVMEIKSSRARSLAVCRRDGSLSKWKQMLE